MTTYVKEQAASEVAASNGNADLGAYNPAWDVALKYFQQNPQDDIGAIQTVYSSMLPPASLTLLATVIGAIYADTYWTGTQLDPNHLSASLQQAEGFNKADCDKAAQVAFSQWYGLLVRDNFASNGLIPKPTVGGVTLSPDVLCNAAGPLLPNQLLTMWNSYFFNGSTGTKSFCYGRAQSVNIPLPITQPKLQMFFTDAGFLPPPNSWIQMFTFGGSTTAPMQGIQSGPITPQGGRAANGVAGSGDAFNFQPQGAGHYCLIAVASTEFFTNNPLESTGNWDSMTWLLNNGAAGWHNIDVQTNDEEVLKFYNQDGRPERFVFEAHCANVPAGTKVSLRSTGGGLVSNVESGDVKIYKGHQVVRAEGVAPANYTGELVIKIDTPDSKLLPAGASVQVRKLWALEQGHTHYAQAVEFLRAHREASQGQTLLVPMGDYTFVGAAE
ncbi:MAG: hypothetical protein ABW208_03225 [Pyrinomonadaceae bacterium]